MEKHDTFIRYKWYKLTHLHNDFGPAVICVYKNSGLITKFWYKDGKRHRIGGPAILNGSGDQEWYLNGLPHRDDGPAIIISDEIFYFLNGRELTEQEYYLQTPQINKKIARILELTY